MCQLIGTHHEPAIADELVADRLTDGGVDAGDEHGGSMTGGHGTSLAPA